MTARLPRTVAYSNLLVMGYKLEGGDQMDPGVTLYSVYLL
jgi:hypothetical protein